jgi:hypothetical protein
MRAAGEATLVSKNILVAIVLLVIVAALGFMARPEADDLPRSDEALGAALLDEATSQHTAIPRPQRRSMPAADPVCLISCRSSAGPPLAGVSVSVGGEVLATSDRRGMAAVRRSAVPALATKPGFEPARVDVARAAAEIVLHAATWVAGRVVDEQRRPLPGAAVTALIGGAAPAIRCTWQDGVAVESVPETSAKRCYVVRALSDDSGEFAITVPADMPAVFLVQKFGYLPAQAVDGLDADAVQREDVVLCRVLVGVVALDEHCPDHGAHDANDIALSLHGLPKGLDHLQGMHTTAAGKAVGDHVRALLAPAQVVVLSGYATESSAPADRAYELPFTAGDRFSAERAPAVVSFVPLERFTAADAAHIAVFRSCPGHGEVLVTSDVPVFAARGSQSSEHISFPIRSGARGWTFALVAGEWKVTPSQLAFLPPECGQVILVEKGSSTALDLSSIAGARRVRFAVTDAAGRPTDRYRIAIDRQSDDGLSISESISVGGAHQGSAFDLSLALGSYGIRLFRSDGGVEAETAIRVTEGAEPIEVALSYRG